MPVNIAHPKQFEPINRRLDITPEMHRPHNSTLSDEHDSNYGFFLSCQNRLFNSYAKQAANSDRTMPKGLDMTGKSRDK